jgi:hypothetical protein
MANESEVTDEPKVTAEKAARDRAIEQTVARAPKMTPEQAARLRRLFRYGSLTQQHTEGLVDHD